MARDRVRRVFTLGALEIDGEASVTRDERDVEQPECMTDVAMVRCWRTAGGSGRETMGVVVVRNDHDVAAGIIAADVAPIDRAATDEDRERRRNRAGKEAMTRDARPHTFLGE